MKYERADSLVLRGGEGNSRTRPRCHSPAKPPRSWLSAGPVSSRVYVHAKGIGVNADDTQTVARNARRRQSGAIPKRNTISRFVT